MARMKTPWPGRRTRLLACRVEMVDLREFAEPEFITIRQGREGAECGACIRTKADKLCSQYRLPTHLPRRISPFNRLLHR